MDLAALENAVIARLMPKWPKGTVEFDVGKGFESVLANQAISVTTEKIMFGESGLQDFAYELQPVVSVYMLFKSVQPATRRSGIYPIVVATAALLVGSDLGLDIKPFAAQGPIVEIFHSALAANKMAAFRLDLLTSVTPDAGDEETLEKLIMTANDYLYRENEFEETQIINLPHEDI